MSTGSLLRGRLIALLVASRASGAQDIDSFRNELRFLTVIPREVEQTSSLLSSPVYLNLGVHVQFFGVIF